MRQKSKGFFHLLGLHLKELLISRKGRVKDPIILVLSKQGSGGSNMRPLLVSTEGYNRNVKMRQNSRGLFAQSLLLKFVCYFQDTTDMSKQCFLSVVPGFW